ncbi:MAG: hypothetical protein PVG79_06485 [Gemmatimonadales bacterium]|jgi:hypothetical protein
MVSASRHPVRRAVLFTVSPLVAVVALAAASDTALAQATDAPGTLSGQDLPEWARAWSPLAPLGELPRELPAGAAAFPELLTLPAPRVGLVWTAGNPAALPYEVEDSWVRFRAGLLEASGDLRRPLDPGAVSRRRLSAFGWRPLNGQAGVVGRVVVDRTNLKDGAFADVLRPYGSNPFVVIDTVGDELGRTAARLEGASGWRIGRLGLGLSLGYEAAETRTVASAAPRLNRSGAAGAVGGLALELSANGGLRLGVSGRWRRSTQHVQIYTIQTPTRVYEIQGYGEPVPLDLQPATYVRRLERDEWALGLSLAGRALGGHWALFARTENLSEGQHNEESNDPLTDRWEVDGWRAGAAYQRQLGEHLLLTAGVRASSLWGEARLADPEGVVFTCDEERWAADVELRFLGPGGWEAAALLTLLREDRTRRDRLAGTRSEVRAWQRGAGVAIGRRLGSRFAVAASAGLAGHQPAGAIPDPAVMGPVFTESMGPALALSVTGGLATALSLAGRWQVSGTAALWARVRYTSLAPRIGAIRIPLQPSGERSDSRLDLGVVLTAG